MGYWLFLTFNNHLKFFKNSLEWADMFKSVLVLTFRPPGSINNMNCECKYDDEYDGDQSYRVFLFNGDQSYRVS